MKKRVVFLYSELAGYFLESALALKNSGYEVHIVHWPVNMEAPFNFTLKYSSLKLYNRDDYNANKLIDLIKNISPDIILCSGWVDKLYLKICSTYFSKIPTVLTFDNKWKGTIKQRLAILSSTFFLLNKFSHVWVPGKSQSEFANKLGFKKERIFSGFYCADINLFSNYYLQRKEYASSKTFQKLIYIGRYVEWKGINDLWQAFSELDDGYNLNWELHCLGTGPVKPCEHPKIKHFGFVQPENLSKHLIDASLFILPSQIEPWGVIVQEMAAAGLPLILSDQVTSRETFLKSGENGWEFKSGNISSLKRVLLAAMQTDKNILAEMGERSHLISSTIDQKHWVNVISTIVS